MAIGVCTSNVLSVEDILNKASEAQLASYYLGITNIPCVISSPLRVDHHPSFGLYSTDGVKIKWHDLATGERGNIFELFKRMWGLSFKEVLIKINTDISGSTKDINVNKFTPYGIVERKVTFSNSELECKIRDWRDYDVEYWNSFGISLRWLKFAEVYPISHKIVIKNDRRYVFGADKYAYAFVEHKEGKETLKIYQPFNKSGFKWANKHDKSVISLWTKVPETGERIAVCSSLKDALCLWANTGIPALAVQGEGYSMSNTAIKELKRRFSTIYVIFDNDKAGLDDGKRFSQYTGFKNIVIPQFDGGKDLSDYYKLNGREPFKELINNLIITNDEY